MKTKLIAGLIAIASLAGTVHADLQTAEHPFVTGKILSLKEANDQGMRLDAVQFHLPRRGMGADLRAEVAVTNTADMALRVGIAIALFDDKGRLLGVASGGNRALALRPGQQKFYDLSFDHVGAEADQATKFRISVESR
jgi:hypothetical protein